MSVNSRHLLLHYYKIFILHLAFLPAVQVCSSSSETASHGFLDYLVSLVVVTAQVIFHGPEQTVVTANFQSSCDETSLRTVLYSSVSKRLTQRDQTF